MSLDGKVVLVTGGSSGIGAAIAKLFAKEGAKVVIVGRNRTKLNNVTEEIKRTGVAPLVINADIAEDAEGKRIVDETIKQFGKLDVLVNNAGLARNGSLTDGTILQFYDAIMNVNLRAVINVTTQALPYLKASKGNIVNMSSAGSMFVPRQPHMLIYTISKLALDRFTQGAALELAPFGVRVNSINPGPVATDLGANANGYLPTDLREMAFLCPLKKICEPEEIAEIALFLASDKAKSVTGSLYVCDNGISIS